MTTTTHLGITLVEQSQAQKEVTVNAALTRIDAVLNNGAKSRTTNTPPGSPAGGDLYIVGSAPTGGWSGQAYQMAYFDQAWKFIAPGEGMTLWVNDESKLYSYDGTSWVVFTGGGGGGSPGGTSGQVQYNNAGAFGGFTVGGDATLNISTGALTIANNAITGAKLGTMTSAQLATALSDETGTGVVVFGTSPTITTPNTVGTTAVGNAAAGSVGEFLSANVQSGSAVSLTTGTAKTVTSISLTAGDWDVWALAGFHPNVGTTNASTFLAGISATTNTLPSEPWLGGYAGLGIVNQLTSGDYNLSVPPTRINISSTTTYYLVAQSTFSTSTMAGYGTIMARRRR